MKRYISMLPSMFFRPLIVCLFLAASVATPVAADDASSMDKRALGLAQQAEALRATGRYSRAADAVRAARDAAMGDGAKAVAAAAEGLLAAELEDPRAPVILGEARDLSAKAGLKAVAALTGARMAALLAADDLAAARQAATMAKADMAGAPDTVRGAVEASFAEVAAAAGDAPAARVRLAQAEALLSPLVGGAGAARAMIELGVVAERVGEPQVAARVYQRASQAAELSVSAAAQVELARLSQVLGEQQAALAAAEQAMRAAQTVGRDDLIFRAAWRQGRILRGDGATADALKAFRVAFAGLRRIREDTGRTYVGGSSVFRRRYGAFHQEFVDLLTGAPINERQPLLVEARAVMEDLKIEEVEDYFQQRCVADSSDLVRSDALGGGAAVLYPIILPDRLEVLMERDGVIYQHSQPMAQRALTRLVKKARIDIQKFGRAYEKNAGAVYDLLIRPFEAQLSGADTIIFVPDGVLRLLPIAALWDGEEFLVQKFGVATVLGLNLIDPQNFALEAVNTLVVGATEVPSRTDGEFMPRLEAVGREMSSVSSIMGGDALAEDDFKVETFSAALNSKPFGVVHIATHALIGAKPSDNFIAASNGPIDIQDMALSLRARSLLTGERLELLTLSACATARGDDRAPLGLAGVAYTAGARSVLASLWPVFDNPTADLMADFYAGLQNGRGRAAALRDAQMNMLERGPEFGDPAAWAAFTIIGDWR